MERTFADELRGIQTSWIWAGVLVVVFIFGFSLTPWDAITTVLAQGGLGDDGANILAFVAGYTLPLTAGLAIVSFLGLMGAHRGQSAPAVFVAVAVILFVSGLAAASLGLGLLPEYTATARSGPWYGQILGFVLQGYFNTYGTPLMVCAAAIGFGAAVHVERLVHEQSVPPSP